MIDWAYLLSLFPAPATECKFKSVVLCHCILFCCWSLSRVGSLLLHLIIIMLPITPAQLLLLNKCDQHYHWLATLIVTKRDERRFTITITVYSSLMDHKDTHAHTYVEELAGDWMMLINKIGTHFYIFKIAQLCSWFLHSSLVTGHQW